MLLTACVPAGKKTEDKKQESEVSVNEDKQDEESQELMDEKLKASELLTEPVEIKMCIRDSCGGVVGGITNGMPVIFKVCLLYTSRCV